MNSLLPAVLISGMFTLAACQPLVEETSPTALTEGASQAATALEPGLQLGPLPEFFDCVRETGGLLIASHRAGPAPGFPENALETLQYATDQGLIIHEIDVAESRDGVLFLLHDRSLGRTTTGDGAVADTDWETIQTLNLKDNDGTITAFTPPKLTDVLLWAKESGTIVELDRKPTTSFRNIISQVRAAGAENNVVLITYNDQQAIEVAGLAPDLMMTAGIDSRAHQEELEAAGSTPTSAAADQANKLSSSPGVLHLKALLKLQPTDPLPSVEQHDLPTLLVTKFSSCSLVEMDSTAAAIAAEEENIPGLGAKSVSTSSSSQYFTADRPFQSTIRKARYLTHMTSPDAAQRVTEQYFSSNSSTTEASAAWYESAAQIYNEQFPLTGNEKDRNGKRVIEMTLTLPDDLTLEYAPGDSLGLLVDNTPAAVHFILTMLDKYHNIKGDQQITSDHFEGSVRDAITKCIDLSSINPVQPRLLRALAAQCAAGQEEDRLALEYLASRAGHDLFMNMIHEQRWTMIDLLQQFPSLQPQMSLENLFALLPQIPPRYYSVSSSPTVGRELTVTFAVVDYLTPALLDMSERRIHGLATRYLEAVCSPFLCGIEKGSNTYAPTLRIFPKPTADFRLPATIGQSKEQPLILIGPGTGIAPFVGFLRHMKSIQEQAKAQAQTMVEGTWRGDFEVDDVADETKSSMHIKIPPVYVYFGCRNEEHDYLYKDELAQYKREGLISALYTAFSRDGSTERKYVQDCMEEGTLSDLIVNQKAFVYVCGDGNKMAKDVQAKIASLLPGDGPAYLDQMKKEKRFLLDIWS